MVLAKKVLKHCVIVLLRYPSPHILLTIITGRSSLLQPDRNANCSTG